MHFNLNFALSSQYRSCVFIEFLISQECFLTCNVFLLLHLSYDSILSTHSVCFSSQPEHCNVCFWYTPPSVRCLPHGPGRDKRLHQVSAQPQVIGSTRRGCVSPEHSVCVCRWLLRSKPGWWRKAPSWLAISLWEPKSTSSAVCCPILPHNTRTSTSSWTRSSNWAMTFDLYCVPVVRANCIWRLKFRVNGGEEGREIKVFLKFIKARELVFRRTFVSLASLCWLKLYNNSIYK